MANKKVSQLTSKPSVLVTDLFPIADPSTGQLYKTTISDLGTAIGSGVSSVNGLVGAVVLDTDDIQELVSPTNKWFTDTRARAALSASSPLAYNSGTGVFSIPAATSSQNGYLTSTDWVTFNNKLSTATAASTYVPYTGAITNVDLGANNLTAKNLFFKTNGDTFKISNPVASGSFGLNIFIGNGGDNVAYTSADTGSYNTSIGYISLNDITTGYRNTVIGQAAMSGLTSGYFNVAIGDNAGRNFGSSLITTANSSVFIGPLTKASANGNTNEVVIGFEAVGNGSNTVTIGNSSITANYFKGSINANSFVKSSGTSAQFLKADGSVDSSTYLTTSSASSTYLPLTGGTLTGGLNLSAPNWLTFGGVNTIYSNGGVGFFIQQPDASTPTHFRSNTGAVQLTIASGSAGAATFASSVGIGTTPGYPLEVSSSGGSIAYFGTSRTGGGGLIIANSASDRLYLGSANWMGVPGEGTGTTSIALSSAQNSAIIFATNASATIAERLRITNGGLVGIGTNSPSVKLHVKGSANYDGVIDTDNGTTTGGGIFGIRQNGVRSGIISVVGSILGTSNRNLAYAAESGLGHTFFVNDGVRALDITSGGSVYINTTSSLLAGNRILQVIGTAGITTAATGTTGEPALECWQQATSGDNRFISFFTDGSGGSFRGSIDYNRAAGLVRYNITSDYRLKTDFKEFNGSDILNKVKVYDYELKETGSRVYGVIAHELQEVIPYAVTGVKDGAEMQGVDYSKIVPVMVQAIKELKAELDTLKNK